MKKSSSSAAQAVLILIARIAWVMYQSFIKNFTAFNAKYTEQYGKDALAEVDKVAALPSDEEIRGAVTSYLNKLKASGLAVTNLTQMLFKYIEDTFQPSDWAAAKKEAGSALYAKAARGHWASVTKLLEANVAFIIKYKGTLSPGGTGMPATFPPQVEEAKATFEAALQSFALARQNAKLQTAARKAAYKGIRIVLIAMLKDAQRMFRFEPANKKAFTFAAIKRTVAPEASGLHISIKDSITELAITTARIVMQPGNITADTNNKGIAMMKLKAVMYNATVTAPGYETILLNNIQVEAGTVHRIRLQAQKEAAIAS